MTTAPTVLVDDSTPAVQRFAPGKVNLTLAVLGTRPDGYHEIESWAKQIDLRDRLMFRRSSEPGLEVSGLIVGVPDDHQNLVWRAGERVAEAAGRPLDVEIRLEKYLPAGAGLGGGSSDAAATLLGLNELWGLDWSSDKLYEIAGQLGSDVPMFISGSSMILRGRGERVDLLDDTSRFYLVLIIPPYSLSTARVYARCRELGITARERVRPWEMGITESRRLAPLLFNDLEAAAFSCEPQLAQLHREVDGLDDRPVRLTGSGSSLFSIFDSVKEANAWARQARSKIDSEVRLQIVSTL